MTIVATVKIGILLSFLQATTGMAQLKYSIDIEPESNRRVEISYRLKTARENFKMNSEIRQRHRAERKLSRKTRKHIYSIQTKDVKKRMRKAQKKADCFNREKGLLCVTLNKIF